MLIKGARTEAGSGCEPGTTIAAAPPSVQQWSHGSRDPRSWMMKGAGTCPTADVPMTDIWKSMLLAKGY